MGDHDGMSDEEADLPWIGRPARAAPLRGVSRDPGFLRATYERFTDLAPAIAPCDHTFRTEHLPADLVAEALAADLLG